MNELQEKILKMVEKMPAFSSSVTKVLELTSDINCAPKDLVSVIDHDPVMTIKILKLVNSAYFGLSKEVATIKQGVVILGINTLKNLSITIAAMGMLPQKKDGLFNSGDFLLHSLGTATLTRLLSQNLGVPSKDSNDYFVAGLLHDFGKVVLVQYMPEEMNRALTRSVEENIPLYQAEQQEIGSDHTEVGGMLAEKWKLSKDLIISLKEHHAPVSESAKIRDCVIAANQIIKLREFGHAGSATIEPLPDVVANRFSMDLETLNESLGELSDELEKTRVFASL